MTIKRALFALIALMLLPAVANAQLAIVVTPEVDTAAITVVKLFGDNNVQDSATVNLQCDGGSYAPASADLAHGDQHIFVVGNIPQGGVTCTVTENPVLSGYAPEFACLASDPDLNLDTDCAPPIYGPGADGPSSVECTFYNVLPQDGATSTDLTCYVDNVADFVDVDVTKVWEIAGAQQADYDPDVRITLECDAEIEDYGYNSGSVWRKTITLEDEDGDFDDEDDKYVGMGTAEFKVRPDWYPTAE
ncbi:MAG: hypothetical protein ACR2O5_00685, partial [Thiogranum sp.]